MRSVSNRQLTLLRKLNRKKYRQEEQLFFVEGERAVLQVIENGVVEVLELFFDRGKNLWEGEPWAEIIELVDSYSIIGLEFVDIADTDHPQGVLALARIPGETGITDFRDGILVAADRLQDPGNLGTIIRTCTWFGVQGILAGKGTVDLYHPKVVRSTAGSTGVLPWRNSNLHEELSRLQELGWELLILDAASGAENIRTIEIPGKCVLVIGNEANGVDPDLFLEGSRTVAIPSTSNTPGVESLNASVAASIALFRLAMK